MVRRATSEDVGILAEFAVKLWDSHSINEMKASFAGVLNNSDAAVFLAVKDINGMEDRDTKEAEVGFAQVQLRRDYVEGTDSNPVGYLEGIFIEEKYRKKKYAESLLAECEKWALEHGCTEFASDCELLNEESLAFHLKSGFKEASRIICFVKKLNDKI